MALATVVDTLDTIPEAARGAYVEKDGKFHLDFDTSQVPDVVRLKKALDAERGSTKDIRDKIAAWEKLGVSPEDIGERLEKERKAKEEAEIKAGNVDNVLAKRLGDQKLEYDQKLSAADLQRQSALNVARQATIRSELGAALVKFDATPGGMKGLPTLLADRIKIDFDDVGAMTWKILDTDGKPMVGSRSDGLADWDDLVKDTMKHYPELFKGLGGGGGTPRTNGRAGNDPTMTYAEFMALSPKDRAAKADVKGFKLVG